jgi:cell division transport system permease protein
MNPLTSALIAMRRSPYQTLAATLIVSITFFVAYLFSMFMLGAQQILHYFETRPQVIAFFELTTSSDTVTQIMADLEKKPYIADIKLVNKEDALKAYQEDNKADPLLLELVTADILPASLEVSGKNITDLPQIKADLETYSAVDDVIFQQDVIESLTSWSNALRRAGIGSISVLGTTSFLTVLVIISMKVITKKSAIQIMRIIGATRWYIATPFMYEGLIYGLIGSLLGWSLQVILLLYLTPWLKDFLGAIPLLPIPWDIMAIQLGVGTLIGMIFGGFTGIVAVRRLIKR